MPPRTQTGSKELGEAIRRRREELGLTIEQAAIRARIGQKTWSRYESGESIRQDKVRSVCAALGWKTLEEGLSVDIDSQEEAIFLKSFNESNQGWSPYLARMYGRKTAVTFCLGSEILGDELRLDLEQLATKPKGTHLGELDISMTLAYLPEQFVPRYDYDFVYRLRARLEYLRIVLRGCDHFAPQTVADELLLHMIETEAEMLMEYWEEEADDELSEAWVAEVCGDDDFETFLGAPWSYVDEGHAYFFDYWFDDWSSGLESAEQPARQAE